MMSKDASGRETINEGIQANTVQAEVMSVGRGAQATKTVTALPTADLTQAVAGLQAALAQLVLQPQAKQVLDEDVGGLAKIAAAEKPDREQAKSHLKGISDKLRMGGIVLGDIASLAEPARRVAELLRVPLSYIGLG